MLHPTILRAYDIRGIVNKTLFEKDAYLIGKAFATLLRPPSLPSTICVGYDGRLSSPSLSQALTEGLCAAGANVMHIGVCPTPMLYFAVKHSQATGGIMITGSHNPPEYNGFKLMQKNGPFFGQDITQLGHIIHQGTLFDAPTKGTSQSLLCEEAYLIQLKKALDGKKARPLKIAWDPGNGATGHIIETLTKQLPGTHILLNEKIDGTFPAHHPDPSVPENLTQLIKVVKKEKCDVGIAFDGDGDRIGAVDNKGRILWGDHLVTLLAQALLKKSPGALIIADVKTSQTVFDEVTRCGGKPYMYKTGHSFIKAKLAETGAHLAGEMSGHIFFKENNGFDDGIYAALKLIDLLSHTADSLATLFDKLPHWHNTPEIRIPITEEKKFATIETIKENLKKENIPFSDVDGVRVNNGTGWWLLRASNTDAIIVGRCEASTKKALQLVKKEFLYRLQQVGVTITV